MLPVHVGVQAVVAGVAELDLLHLHVVDVDGLQEDLQLGHHGRHLAQPCWGDPGHASCVSLLQSSKEIIKFSN